jgi:hypothetical protein
VRPLLPRQPPNHSCLCSYVLPKFAMGSPDSLLELKGRSGLDQGTATETSTITSSTTTTIATTSAALGTSVSPGCNCSITSHES